MSMNSFHARQKKPRPAPQPAHERPAGMLRADALLVAQGLAPSRTFAQLLIKEGRVSWAGGPISKPALELPEETPLTVAADPDAHFVSRGGRKLAGALTQTGLSAGANCASMSANRPAASPTACSRPALGT